MPLCVDYRLGGEPRYFLGNPDTRLMIIPEQVRKSVCFLGAATPKGISLQGTGLFLSKRFEQKREHWVTYLVTAKPIITGMRNKFNLDTMKLRINIKDGGVRCIDIPLDDNAWAFHPEDPFNDVAILKEPMLYHQEHDVLSTPDSILLSEEKFKTWGIGLGDEVIIVGLFHRHYGRQRNTPIVRVGNLAALPEERVRTRIFGNDVEIDAYLIEARSISGLSGSPVFVNPGQFRIIGGKAAVARDPVLLMLGLIHGHWDEHVAAEETDAAARQTRSLINTGVAIVTPAVKIVETLNHPDLVEQREGMEKKLLEEQALTLASGDTLIEEGADNPQHKEDFNRLLDAAVRGRKPKP